MAKKIFSQALLLLLVWSLSFTPLSVSSQSRKPDLRVNIECPTTAYRGWDIAGETKVYIGNWGTERATRIAVDLVLSSDTQIPVAPGNFSPNYREDVLLEGGHLEVDFLRPTGQNYQELTLPGQLKIPADTPPGTYYIGAVIDPIDWVEESQEDNNSALCRVDITCPPPLGIAECSIWPERAVFEGNAIHITWVFGNKIGLETISIQGDPASRLWIQNIQSKDSSGRWVREISGPREVMPATATETSVGLIRPISEEYRIVFKAEYPCERQRSFTFEVRLPSKIS